MRRPKLKYYYCAMAEGNYRDFESSRAIRCAPQATIDINTGAVTGQSFVYLCESGSCADDNYRDLYKTSEPLFILRIPAEYVHRHDLRDTAKSGVWEYRRSMLIPHCGVERFELDSAAQVS